MSASDGDGDEITYSLAGADEHFVIDANTGQIDLIKSFDRETIEEARLEVWATDNGKSSSVSVYIFAWWLSSVNGTHGLDIPCYNVTID